MAQSGNGKDLNHDPAGTGPQIDEKRRRVLDCIDRVLTKLGSDVRRAITYYMRREYSLKHYEIPDKPHEFQQALRQVFGRSSSGIEREITELIVAEFHLEPEMKVSFEKAVRAAISN